MPDDEFDAKLGEMIGGEFDGSTDDGDDGGESTVDQESKTESPESTASTDSTSSSETTRSMAQYSMYLPEIRTQELKTLYQRINLQRLENDEPEIEKNRHFNRAVVETALDHEDEIRERVDELTE